MKNCLKHHLLATVIIIITFNAQADIKAEWKEQFTHIQEITESDECISGEHTALKKGCKEFLAPPPIPLENAIRHVLEVEAGRIIHIVLSSNGEDNSVYQVELLTENNNNIFDFFVDATTGEVKLQDDDEEATFAEIELASLAQISMIEAIHIAESAAPGNVIEAKISKNWGKALFQVAVAQSDLTLKIIEIDAVNKNIFNIINK